MKTGFFAGMTWLGSAAFLLALGGVATAAEDLSLQSARLHLGRIGQWEWDEFKDRPVDAERVEVRFSGKVNPAEQTLRIWHSGVKLGWAVLLNGRKLGTLPNAEPAMESVLTIPAGALIEGENVLRIDAPFGHDDIEVGPIFLAAKPVVETLSGAELEVTVTDAETNEPLPCRLTLTRRDGTLQPLRAVPESEVAVRVGVVYTRNGRATLHVPPGDYILHAGRGFEWSVPREVLSLKTGGVEHRHLRLRREVDTRGWVAADSHIHTRTYSGHGDASVEERLLTIAGEGIELAIATDHNHHTDYASLAASSADRFTPVIGNEVTTKIGHFNAFPISPGTKPVDSKVADWATLLPAIRAMAGVKVVTLNHPRDLHSGFIPLGKVVFDPKTGKHRDAEVLDVDAMEVVTSAAMQSDIHLLFRDWFALLNRGHRIAAIGASDTHDVSRFILGQSRTYVAVDDANPARLDLDQVWRSYQEGRLLVSFGLLATVKVDERFTVGDLATGLGDELKVEAVVSGPSWAKADRLELFANGILIREQALQDDRRGGEKARITWKISRPAHDVHLVAIATGPGVTEPFWEIPRPYQPTSKSFVPRVIGATNPIWIDGNNDGRFQSAHAIAQDLLRRSGANRDQLRELAQHHDEAVRVQVEALSSN